MRYLKTICYSFLTLLVLSGLLMNPKAVNTMSPAVGSWLWGYLEEGQQIAVVTLQDTETARVDVYLSIRDKTRESHEINFFVPLGVEARGFYAVEEDVTKFEGEYVASLDSFIERRISNRRMALHTLFSGALLSNGGILAPLWAPALLTSCAPATVEPSATFKTESSDILIFDINENVDIESLVKEAGLPASVNETIAGLKGQQIAVVKLQTNPQVSPSSGKSKSYENPGIHLSWTATLVPDKDGNTYSYQLGTGASWSKPIELTKVYVVAPPGIDFNVQNPVFGSDQSGYELFGGPKIDNFRRVPAYAVEDARGDFGRVWRVTYTQSNPSKDIVIKAFQQATTSKFRNSLEQGATSGALLFAILISILFWILSWIFLMPRLLGKESRVNVRGHWYYSLVYVLINAGLIFFPGSVLYLVFALGLGAPALALVCVIFGGVSILVFTFIHAEKLGVSKTKGLRAFIITSLASSFAYIIVSLTYAKLVGMI
ncbi:MAG: hypothetical protein JSV54_04030 [Chloroflexota bacterium]|nr:MAG: hypothetical protein JSV54_04030 [Chloroflexota bacterium]